MQIKMKMQETVEEFDRAGNLIRKTTEESLEFYPPSAACPGTHTDEACSAAAVSSYKEVLRAAGPCQTMGIGPSTYAGPIE